MKKLLLILLLCLFVPMTVYGLDKSWYGDFKGNDGKSNGTINISPVEHLGEEYDCINIEYSIPQFNIKRGDFILFYPKQINTNSIICNLKLSSGDEEVKGIGTIQFTKNDDIIKITPNFSKLSQITIWYGEYPKIEVKRFNGNNKQIKDIEHVLSNIKFKKVR